MASMLGGFVTLAACSNQGEGDRCQAENGNEDCQTGLVCLPATVKPVDNGGTGLVNPPYNNSDRCCPPDRAKANHPACVPLNTSATGDGAPPPGDTGPKPDVSVDSAAETSTPDADAAGDADAD